MNRTGALALALVAIASAACVRRETTTVDVTPDPLQGSAGMKSATNLPPQFTVVTAAGTPGDCPPELRDPGLRTVLRLRRSVLRPVSDSTASRYRAVGDYAVEPRGLYGEEEGEGLRVDCARLSAIGVVRL
jgi:hypothetical protein